MKRGVDRRKSSPRDDAAVVVDGMKFDDGKLRYDLIDEAAEAEFVAVLTYGAIKYDPENWRTVSAARRRYRAAIRRHLAAYIMGEELDPETGLMHLAHAVCNVHFLLGLELEGQKGEELRKSLQRRLAGALESARKMRAEREKKARAG